MVRDTAITIALALLCSLVLSEDFNSKRVNLIDRAGVNWLFRGGEPKNSSNMFVYSELVATMQQVALSQANTSLPSSFYLLDLSFESYELEDKLIERSFFAENPHLGNFTDWVIIGDFTGPNNYPASVVKERAITLEQWQLDKLPSRIVNLHSILHSQGPNDLPVVIYIHCEAGSDRTGEVSGAYYLTYLNFSSYADVMALDDKIAGRPIKNESANALQWYELVLLLPAVCKELLSGLFNLIIQVTTLRAIPDD